MLRRSCIAVAITFVLLAGCQDQKKNQQVTAKKDDVQPYNPPAARPLDSMDNTQNPNSGVYSQNPPPNAYDYNNANTPPAEKMTPKSSGKSHAKAGGSAGKHTYIVQKGDTYAKIAKKVYGDSSKWKKIANANKSKVPDPKKLKVGTKLTIP